MITFSTSSKEIPASVPAIQLQRLSGGVPQPGPASAGEYTNYQVTMVIKSKKSYDEGYLLQLMQEFPEVTVEKIE